MVHELHAVGEDDPPARLHFIALQELRPLVFAFALFGSERVENVLALLGNFGVLGGLIVDFAKDVEGFGVAMVCVEVTWGFREAEYEDDDELYIYVSTCWANIITPLKRQTRKQGNRIQR